MKTVQHFLLVLYCLTLFSCTPGEQPQSQYPDPFPLPPGALQVPLKGQYGGRLTTAIVSEPTTFNPLLAYEADSQAFNQLTGAGLTRLNLITQQPEPALAHSWETSQDQLTWTFHLR